MAVQAALKQLAGRTKDMGHEARAKCTPNMEPMLVTLDVSKLSG